MKKILRGVCLMGVVALLATSCNKNKETATITTVNQEMEVVAGEWNDGEKVQLNPSNNQLYFEEGDLLTLFRIAEGEASTYADYTPALTQVDNTTWTPVGEALAEGGDLYAFCPGGSSYITPNLANENRATFKVPAMQNYRENTCPTEGFFMASKLEAGQTAFYFRNICGLLWLKLYSPNNRVVKSIVVTDKKGHHLSGDVTLKIDKVNPTTLTSLYRNYSDTNPSYAQTLAAYIEESGYEVANAGSTMTLNCGDGVQIGTTSGTATSFYMTLRPLALRGGFDVTISGDDWSYTMSTTKNNIIGPSVIKKMPALNVQ